MRLGLIDERRQGERQKDEDKKTNPFQKKKSRTKRKVERQKDEYSLKNEYLNEFLIRVRVDRNQGPHQVQGWGWSRSRDWGRSRGNGRGWG